MEDGWADSAGSIRSMTASTERRSSSKKAGSFIAAENSRVDSAVASRFTLTFRIKRLRRKLAVGFLEEDFYAAFRLFQLLLAFSRECHTFLEELHGVIQGKLRAF